MNHEAVGVKCVCILALFNQHAKRMRHFILPSSAFPTVQYLSILSHKRHDFLGGGVGDIEHKMDFDFLYNFCVKDFSFYEQFRKALS